MSTVPARLQAWERFAPLSGVVAVVLWIVGVILIESGGTPDEDEGAQVVAAYYDENSTSILAGAFIFMLGAAVFIWFLGTLRARIHASEGGVGRLASIVFGAGLVTAAMTMAFVAPEGAAAFGAQEVETGLEPAAVQALALAGDGFFIAAVAAVAVFYAAAAVAGLRTGTLPVWLAWASIVLAVAALFPWVGWAVFIWGLPLWVLVASIWMFVRPTGRADATERAAAVP